MIESLSGFGQPILTANGINPVVGDVFNYQATNYVNPGAAGANQTWNLSTMTVQAVSQTTAVSSGSTPYSATFTNSNICFLSPGQYDYFLASNTAYQSLGSYVGNGPAVIYNPPKDILQYPFIYNTSYTTNYQSSSPGPNPTAVSGTVTVSYDGYGTLVLPNGTYTNAIRIHSQDIYTQNQGTVSIDVSTTDLYNWYINGNHLPVATVSTFTSTSFGTFSSGAYLNSIATSIHSTGVDNSTLRLFPSPSKNTLNIKYGYVTDASKAELIDMDSKVVITNTIEPGSADHQMDISSVAKGVYVVKVYFSDGTTLTSKVVIE